MNFIKKILFFLLLIPSLAQAQVITTVAGNGTVSFCGDGGPATAGCLYWPYDIVVDKHGNIYFSELANSIIRKVDAAGVISTFAGQGFNNGYNGDSIAATAALLNTPCGIALDGVGNLYIADRSNNRVRRVDTAGIITTVAGTGIAGYNGDNIPATSSQIDFPSDVVVDSNGYIYISDPGNFRIRKVSPSGIITTIAGMGIGGFSGDGGAATVARLRPSSIALDKHANIYVTDSTTRVRKISLVGVIFTIAGNGTNMYSGDGGLATSAGLGDLAGIAVDDTGNIYLPDYISRVRKIDTSGIISRIAGLALAGYSGDGGNPLLAQLSGPTGVAINTFGYVYIAEEGSCRIRCIDYSKTAGITEIRNNNAGFSIFPNPANNGCFSFTINSLTNEVVLVRMCNVLGVTVRELDCNTNTKIPITLDAPKGMYYLQVITSSGTLTEKILIE